MYVDYSPEQRALSEELRKYFDKLMTPERREAMTGMEGGRCYRETVRQMGQDGWLGVGWPREYGGQGRTAIEQLIFFDEVRRAGAPYPFVTLNTVGPVLIEQGTEEQKATYLPQIVAGEIHFAIGYTEPDAGTDLASLKTSAVKDGSDYVINGTKIFTSGANDADYIWLAARTDPDAPKHKGITMFIMDAGDPGFSSSLIHTVNDGATCMTYYEGVRIPESNIVGALNGGWRLITAQLNHERIGLAAFGGVVTKHVDDVAQWARTTRSEDGTPVIDKPWVQLALAEAQARAEASKLMNWRMAWGLEQNQLDMAEASAVKVFGTEQNIEIYRLLLDVLGASGTVRRGSAGAILMGEVQAAARVSVINTFGGGINEVQREIVSMAGLRMPRVPR